MCSKFDVTQNGGKKRSAEAAPGPQRAAIA